MWNLSHYLCNGGGRPSLVNLTMSSCCLVRKRNLVESSLALDQGGYSISSEMQGINYIRLLKF